MTYDTLNRITNPVVRNAIIANATYADDADGLIDYTDRDPTVATNSAPAGRRWSVHVG